MENVQRLKEARHSQKEYMYIFPTYFSFFDIKKKIAKNTECHFLGSK